MPHAFDIILVIASVGLAGTYLVWRKTRALKKINRDWATGRADVCDHCPAIKIQQAKLKQLPIKS